MDDRLALLGLNLVEGLGPVKISSLIAFFGSPLDAWNASLKEVLQVPGIGEKIAQALLKVKKEKLLERELELMDKWGISFLTLLDEGYPVLLKEIENHPPVLYIKGSLKNDVLTLAVVGTRKPSPYGRKVAREFSKFLASSGVCIISGLARGIDSEAHKGALEGGGTTYAVLGSGILNLYPPELKGLAEEIASRGALLSEYPLFTPPLSGNFPRRNRIISGISKGVLVVEAPLKSGAMITVSYALDQGRDVFAVPGSIYSSKSEGPNLLIQQGAKPALKPEDILEEYGVKMSFAKRDGNILDISEEERRILDKLPVGEVFPIDNLFYDDANCGKFAIITMLELKGYLKRVEGNKVIRVK
ncbi:MAG: DNA-processing protein DprA [Synergistetes bacterium]|nr:DNA-processing protein DprA [Synergistota bacterium]MDW8193016.1 DNA-processing protein DprA [Synergistota bacterium]